MGKILLTSSQVNVIVTSVIGKSLPTRSHSSILTNSFLVVLCTSALFLSGYVIQQRTLHELRVAIKPRPSRPSPKVSPNFYLPEQFKTPTTKLDDGTILVLGGELEAEAKQQQQVIEVELTAPEQVEEKQVKPVKQKAQVVAQKKKKTEKKKGKGEMVKEETVKHSWAVDHPDPLVKTEKPISRAERRRLIKEEIRRLSQLDKPLYYQRRLW